LHKADFFGGAAHAPAQMHHASGRRGGCIHQQKHGGEIMWIMQSDCFLSIVSKDCGPTELLVRARRNGDIEKVFPSAKVIRSTGTDYLYRAVIPRDAVKEAVTAMIDHVDYPNFKDSVEDRSLHAAYVGDEGGPLRPPVISSFPLLNWPISPMRRTPAWPG
jgi:hypothetical protein